MLSEKLSKIRIGPTTFIFERYRSVYGYSSIIKFIYNLDLSGALADLVIFIVILDRLMADVLMQFRADLHER